ncbi:hydrogenase maturation nickel metallochaperone HypA [archaeon]|nr:hydrogenase maturation nickel metallochaperone HypA [archaeon]
MHEFYVAKRLFDLAVRAALENGAQGVREVKVVIGELSLVNPEQLAFWFRELSRGTVLEGARLDVEVEEAEVSCPSCGYVGPVGLEDRPEYHLVFPTLRCPVCGGKVRVLKGRDCFIRSMRVVKKPKTGFRPQDA